MNFPTLLCLLLVHVCAVANIDGAPVQNSQCKRKFKPCAMDLCCCRGSEAYCEGHGKKLGYIPKLRQSIKQVRFMNNFLPQLSREAFKNLSKLALTSLAIVNDGVLNVTTDAFTDLQNLSKLEISTNPRLNETELSLSFGSLQNSNLTTLILKNIGMVSRVPTGFLKHLDGSNITSLILDDNRLVYVSMSDFQYLRCLKHLRLVNNTIREFNVSKGHPTLMVLLLTHNQFGREPPSFCPSEVNTFPRLKSLNLEQNFICDIAPQAWKCLSNLTHLAIGGNVIRYIPNNTISDLTALEVFRVNGMLSVSIKVDKLAFNSTSLRELRFDSNNVIYTKELAQSQSQIFAACKQITYLDISKNNLVHLSDDSITKMLAPLTKLKKLYMVSTRLRSIPETLLKNFPDLQFLNVDGNGIQELGNSLLGPSNLNHLSIQGNNLRVLTPESVPPSIMKTLQTLNLADNSFACSCENLWFRNLISENGTLQGTNISLISWPMRYRCYSPREWNGKLLQSFRPTEASCRTDRLILYVCVSLGSVLLIFAISVPLCVRYRWHIQYMWYKFKKTKTDDETKPLLDEEGNRLPAQPYTYVIYHDSDRNFVHHALRKMVEEDFGYKLYIWHRNAAHGSKANIMFDAIHESSHVLAVISSKFVTDGWCEFQLDIGLEKKNESRKDCLTLLLLENLDRSLLRRSWCVTLVKNATLHWFSDPDLIQSRVCIDQLKSRLKSNYSGSNIE